MPKYQDPSLSGSSDILFTRLFLYKMPVSEKGGKRNRKFTEQVQKLTVSTIRPEKCEFFAQRYQSQAINAKCQTCC